MMPLRGRGSLSRRTRGLAALVGLALLGCGGTPPQREPVGLTVYVPCVIAGPMRDVLMAYETAHPHVEMTMETDKPLALLAQAEESQQGPAVVVTMGDVEMRWLAGAGAVTSSSVRTIAVNTYPLVVAAAADGAVGVEDLAGLAGDGVAKILLEDSAQSSLGDRAEQGLKQLGLWEEIAPKVVRPKPDDMLLANVVDGEADAAVLFRDCLSGDADVTRSVPKTLRIIAEIPADTYSPIPYQAAALRSASGTEVADAFVEFLVSREGKAALAAAGLVPASGLVPPSGLKPAD